MIIDNKRSTINLQLRRLLFLFLLSIAIVTFLSLSVFRNPVFGVDRQTYSGIAVGLFVLYYFFGISRNYHYFFFTDNGSKIICRFYSLNPLSKRQNSIEIDKNLFVKCEIISKMMGLQKYLVLYQKMPNGAVARYKPVSITLLSRKHRNDLNKALANYLRPAHK